LRETSFQAKTQTMQNALSDIPQTGVHSQRSNMNIRKVFLYLLIASVAVSALIGIAVIIMGDFGEFEIRVLLTMLTITVTSILGLACGACLEAGRARFVPLLGVAMALVSAGSWMIMIWAERTESDIFPRFVMTATLLSFACSHISLLTLARLDPRFLWSRWAAHAAVWSLSVLILSCIWFKVDPSDALIARAMGVLSIVIGALTVVTPVFHRLSAGDSINEIDAEITRLKEQIGQLEAKRAGLSGSRSRV